MTMVYEERVHELHGNVPDKELYTFPIGCSGVDR